MKVLIRRIKRFFKFFKLVNYGGWSWWIPIPSKDRFYAGSHCVLCDRETYNKKGIKFLIKKIEAAWYLAKNYILNDDGLYEILKETNDEEILYKVSF